MFKKTLLAAALAASINPALAATDSRLPGAEALTTVTDGAGNTYLAGYVVPSDEFPLMNQIPQQFPSLTINGFVTKFDLSGGLVYSTYISQFHSVVESLVVDSEGHAYISGTTECLLSGANDQGHCTHDDATGHTFTEGFVAKIGPFGQFFAWAWHVGGTADEFSNTLVNLNAGEVTMVGETRSPDFPVTRHVATCGNPTGEPFGASTLFTATVGEHGIVDAWCGEEQAASTTDTAGFYAQDQGRFLLKNEHTGGSADHNFRFGPNPGARLPIAGDWNHNGQTTIGLYDQAMGQFWLGNELRWTRAHYRFRFGPKGTDWLPLAGDWNGDGTTTVGLYDPMRSRFFLRGSHTPGPADVSFRFGPEGFGWLPIVGDWDGDGTDTIGLYDPIVGTFYLKNSLAGGAADMAFRFGPGLAGWLPLAGDWDADGVDTVGLYDPAGSRYHLINSHAGGTADVSFRYGPFSSGWLPIAGDWDGN